MTYSNAQARVEMTDATARSVKGSLYMAQEPVAAEPRARVREVMVPTSQLFSNRACMHVHSTPDVDIWFMKTNRRSW